MKIVMDVFHNPEQHVRNFGIVTSVPEELLAVPLLADSIGLPRYHEDPPFEWKTNQDIQLDIKEGDKVYFHQNCLMPDNMASSHYNNMHLFSQKENGVWMHYFRIKYDLVFAAIRYERLNTTVDEFSWDNESKLKKMSITNAEKSRDVVYGYVDEKGFDQLYRKKVVMVGSYCFVEPDMETWDDISIPLPIVINGKRILNQDGSVKMRPKEEWLVTKQMPSERYLRGWVRFAGSPLIGDKEFVRAGMYVYFQRHANTHVKFEGINYFRMRQRHIFGIDNFKFNEPTYGEITRA